MPRLPPFHRLLLAVAAALVAVSCSVTPSPPVALARGERIYREQCANCHGPRGEGVDDKYREALVGDWSLPKLTRYVAANMPDDAPTPLSPADAAAVSAFIHEAFYSPAAQARLRPVRVELARLTNRQYAVTVADLLRRFGPAATAVAPVADTSPGLAATYYNVAQRGRFDPAKLVHRGTDASVDFAFPANGELRARLALPPVDRPPTPNSREPAGFSAQWRGSVFADETGDHEFVIRTPNSVRVWINADPAEPPTVDVNVSTPDRPDHRVTVRLLGGRRYPIVIDWWALAEKAGSSVVPAISLRWKPPHGNERPIPARNLSTAKAEPTFVIATRFPADDSSHGYERGISVAKAWDEATTSAAFEVANHVVRRLDRLAGLRRDDPERAKKIEAFAARFVAAAFRRPLTPDETARFVTALLRGAPDGENGLRRVVLLALKSPHFLYPELPGAAPGPRTAARLALALWDSAPDAALERAAASGLLATPADARVEAVRLVEDPRTRAKVREFFQGWLQLRYLEDLSKDPRQHADFTPEIIDDLRASLAHFVDEVIWSPRSDFRELLRAEDIPVNARLARFYGLPAPADDDAFVRVAAPAGERAGVLTHPYLLAALSYKSTTSPIHRGVFLTRSIVGRALKSPPVAQAFDEAHFEPGMTMREKVAQLTRSENCMGCHAVINPLGFSLEGFDAVGRARTTDNAKPVDTVSTYTDDDGRTVRLAGPRDVADFALGSERAQQNFVEQLFLYLVKQPPAAYGPATLAKLRDSFVASGFNVRQLLVEISLVAALHGAPPPHAPLASASHFPRAP